MNLLLMQNKTHGQHGAGGGHELALKVGAVVRIDGEHLDRLGSHRFAEVLKAGIFEIGVPTVVQEVPLLDVVPAF